MKRRFLAVITLYWPQTHESNFLSIARVLLACVISFLLVTAGCTPSQPQQTPPGAQSGNTQTNSLESKQQTCERGDFAVCNELGVAYLKGENVDKDAQRGLTYLRKACDGNISAACFQLGVTQLMGSADSAKDVVSGVASLKKACDGKHGDACFLLGTIAEGLIVVQGFEPDHKLAKSYYKKACEYGNQEACSAAK
jgi:TPR repeat protein